MNDVAPPLDTLVVGGFIFVLLAAIVGFILVTLRGSDPGRAVASVEAAPGAPFTLRFTPAQRRKHDLFLLFDVEFEGGEDDYGLTAAFEVRIGGGAPQVVEHRIGDKAPEIGPDFTQNNTLYRGFGSSGMGPTTQGAAAPLAELPAVSGEVVITGKVLVAAGVTARRLLVYAVPS